MSLPWRAPSSSAAPRSRDTRPPPHKHRRRDSPGGASHRRETAARFLDLEAAEDRNAEEEDEDQTLEDIAFIDDSVRDDERGSRTGDRRRAPPPLGRLVEEEEPEDLHALADKITERHRAQHPIPHAHTRSPTPQDPCLFRVVVPHGEPQLFISQCMTELLSPHMPTRAQLLRNIFISLFHRPGDPHIYFEVTPGDMFDQEVQRLHACIDKLIPLSERLALLHLPPPSALETGWARCKINRKRKRGPFNGDLVFVDAADPVAPIQELGDGVYLFKKLTFKDGLLFYTTGPPSFRHYMQLSVEPTQDELDLFSQRPNVIFYVLRPITPMSHMVVVGDRVVSWSQNFQGWIQKIEVVIEDWDGQQVEVCYAHVQQLGDKPLKLSLHQRGGTGVLEQIRPRHPDRRGAGLLKIVDYDQLIADGGGGDETHTLREVRVNHVWKVFFGGDIVRVTYGLNRGRTGFVIVGRHRNHDGLVQVYDPLVPNLVSEDYAADPENAHRDIDTRFFSVLGGWLEFALEHEVDGTQSTEGAALEFGAGRNEDRWRSTSSILQQARVDQKDGQTYDRIEADHLMRIVMGTGNVLQNREVYVNGGAHLVKGEYGLALDFNATRSLPKNMDRRALLLEALSSRASVYEGAMVWVRLERSHQIVNVPIESESTGEWMCVPGLVDKRVDVVIRGLAATLGKRDIKPGRALLRLENHHGYLLLTVPLTPDNLEKKCVTVYGLGGVVPQMPRAVAVKPLRELEDGSSILSSNGRVVVIGPDVEGHENFKGFYGQVRPSDALPLGQAYVRLVGSPETHTFRLASLCRSLNEQIVLGERTFPIIYF
ncbi:hypothetical protein DFH07DRAFT_766766 [Mycena maculata]|uniref:Chromatin elongation factor spt5 n=1 Tax=Mycena maculata TaxID=230809 RepID=A0AAD7K4N7_9AGAR|nr:hypothetical protein DFH07DRAFT_766766 [Mycena maculata]